MSNSLSRKLRRSRIQRRFAPMAGERNRPYTRTSVMVRKGKIAVDETGAPVIVPTPQIRPGVWSVNIGPNRHQRRASDAIMRTSSRKARTSRPTGAPRMLPPVDKPEKRRVLWPRRRSTP